jgi:hypothetical protein
MPRATQYQAMPWCLPSSPQAVGCPATPSRARCSTALGACGSGTHPARQPLPCTAPSPPAAMPSGGPRAVVGTPGVPASSVPARGATMAHPWGGVSAGARSSGLRGCRAWVAVQPVAAPSLEAPSRRSAVPAGRGSQAERWRVAVLDTQASLCRRWPWRGGAWRVV